MACSPYNTALVLNLPPRAPIGLVNIWQSAWVLRLTSVAGKSAQRQTVIRRGAFEITMSEHRATIRWNRDSEDFSYRAYSRNHTWEFENGITIDASAAPDFLGAPENLDPEEAYVAALSSCHMLTFLAIASRQRLTIDAYTDFAVGYLEKNSSGKLAITRVTLRPQISCSDGLAPSAEKLEKMHHLAHEECFIANSVHTSISIESA